uniref:Disabled homolog 2-interacting protein C-terminal domain-containing protein n=1 Tax=Ciona savignyi TaxID=51511 RepID=H2Z2D1_CIOSA
MSPEARTAQWILNNVATPNKEVKDETHAVLTPKDYEDRIIRLETEVERLRLSVTEGRDAQRNLEAKEHAWAEKLRRAQRAVELLNASEDKLKKQKEEREGKVREISERMKQSDMDHRRERTELKALIESKEGLVREQSDRILRLEEANLRLVATIKRLRARESPNDVIDFIDDEQKRHNDVKNGEFCLHGLSSGSSSSSV